MAGSAPCPGLRMTEQRPPEAVRRWLEAIYQSRDVHQSHFHAWGVMAMRDMLEAARPWLAGTARYEVKDVFAAKRNFAHMQELQVALQRV